MSITGFGLFGSVQGPGTFQVGIQLLHASSGRVVASNDLRFQSPGSKQVPFTQLTTCFLPISFASFHYSHLYYFCLLTYRICFEFYFCSLAFWDLLMFLSPILYSFVRLGFANLLKYHLMRTMLLSRKCLVQTRFMGPVDWRGLTVTFHLKSRFYNILSFLSIFLFFQSNSLNSRKIEIVLWECNTLISGVRSMSTIHLYICRWCSRSRRRTVSTTARRSRRGRFQRSLSLFNLFSSVLWDSTCICSQTAYNSPTRSLFLKSSFLSTWFSFVCSWVTPEFFIQWKRFAIHIPHIRFRFRFSLELVLFSINE